MVQDAKSRHQAHLSRWMERFPDSAHRLLDLDELEALKSENDAKAEVDQRDRPEVCSAYPTFVTVGNTHKCNLTCQMCFKQLDDVENMTLPDMGMARFERVAHELFPHLRTIALSVTGEPLVSRSIFEELDLMRSYGVRGSITSNAMPLSKSGLIESLIPATDTLTISMDGASEPVFNAIRRRAKFDRVLQNIRLFNEARNALGPEDFRPRLHFNHILQWRNVTELPRLIELAKELDVDQVNVEHVYIFENLNPDDSLARHQALTNRMLDEARATALRLGVELLLPDPFDLNGVEPDEAYVPFSDEKLLEQGREKLTSVTFDPQIHERWDEDRLYRAMKEVRESGGGNREYVERLLGERALVGHLRWGVPQLGDSLIPADSEKPSDCTYAWRESFIEYNGLVAPCCNAAMSAGRILAHLDQEESFFEVWNGETYRRLRRSLTSGRCYEFCRTCYLFEPPSEAAWGTNETWIKVGTNLEGDVPVVAAQVPAGKRAVLTEVRSEEVPEGSQLQIYADETPLADFAAVRHGDGWRFECSLDELALRSEQVVHLRSPKVTGPRVEIIGYVL